MHLVQPAPPEVVGPALRFNYLLEHFMSFHFRPLIASLMAVTICLQPVQPLMAANHPNSRMANVNVIELTANVDWDYDAVAPTQAGTGGVSITKDVLRNQILRETARSVFLMTEGRHRVGTVYVYKNGRFGKGVDIQISNTAGRSNASLAKWQNPEGTTTNFLAMDGKAENLRNYARVVAHELGHYVYGFADEYRESGKTPRPQRPRRTGRQRLHACDDHAEITRRSRGCRWRKTTPQQTRRPTTPRRPGSIRPTAPTSAAAASGRCWSGIPPPIRKRPRSPTRETAPGSMPSRISRHRRGLPT